MPDEVWYRDLGQFLIGLAFTKERDFDTGRQFLRINIIIS
jgi:hypothetical protein